MNRSMVAEVAGREIRTRLRTNSYRLITALLALAAIAGPIAIALWPEGDGRGKEVNVGIAGADSGIEERLVLLAADEFSFEFTPFPGPSGTEVDLALSNDEVDVVIEPPGTLIWNDAVDRQLGAIVRFAMQEEAAAARGLSEGLTNTQVEELFRPIEIEQRFVDGAPESAQLLAIAFGALMVGFILPQIFGQLTMMSVVEEKSTGVVEVLLSHIRPRTLLVGKVIGLTILALIQLLAISLGLVGALLVADAIDLPRSVWQFVPILAVSILGGVIVYNTLFALLGSLISRQEDSSQVMMPVFIPLMGGFFVGQIALQGNVDSLAVKILSFVPLTAPMILPVRVIRGAIEPWEIAASLVILAVTIWLLIWAAGRLYEFALLHRGSRIGWKRAWRLATGKPGD